MRASGGVQDLLSDRNEVHGCSQIWLPFLFPSVSNYKTISNRLLVIFFLYLFSCNIALCNKSVGFKKQTKNPPLQLISYERDI